MTAPSLRGVQRRGSPCFGHRVIFVTPQGLRDGLPRFARNDRVVSACRIATWQSMT